VGKLDLNALQVFNSLYKLGITDEEFRAIEEEQRHTERTGLSVKCVKEGYCICVSHDEKHQIIIKRIPKGKPNTRILFKTLITFDDLPEEIYTLHRIAEYRALDSEIKYTATNLEELKDRICDRFADGYPKEFGAYYDYRYYYPEEAREELARKKQELIAKQLKALFWLFGEDFNGFQTKMRKNIPRIVKVFSRNNRRVAIFQIDEDYDRLGGSMWNRYSKHIEQTTLKLKTYTPRDERYNYVSPNREVFIYHDKEIWIDDDLLEKLRKEELEVIARRLESGFTILNADKYNQMRSSIRLELMSARRREQENRSREQLVRRIKKQFEAGKVVRRGIEFTPTSVSYEGVVLKGEKIGEYLVGNHVILQEQPDFNSIYEGYVDYILEVGVRYSYLGDMRTEIRFGGETDITIGKVELKLSKVGSRFYIKLKGKKPRRINREDVPTVLKKAICYHNDPQGYDAFLTLTSRVNLEVQRALEQGGLEFELEIDETKDNPLVKKREKMLLTLPIARRDGKNYVRILGREYKVKDTQALLDLGREVDGWRTRNGKLQRTIRLLYKAIDGITPSLIGEIIKQGQKEYLKMVRRVEREKRKKIKRSLEFLNHAVRLSGARKVKGGYLVKGSSGNIYFVDKGLKVWTVRKDGGRYVPDKYLCIVDGTWNDEETELWSMNDRLARRLLALAKDSKVAGEIYLRGDRVDSWWRDIQNTDDIKDIQEEVV